MRTYTPDIEIYTEGDELYQAMLDDIAGAESTVRFESYIFADDEVGARFFTKLAERAQAGRQITMRLDSAGSWGITRIRVRALRAAGVVWRWSRPWSWVAPWAFHRRNHRKLMIVDDRVAYLGGFNIHRECSISVFGETRWRDTHVRITGDLVPLAAALFDRFPRAPRLNWQGFPRGTRLLPNANQNCRHLLRCAFTERFAAARKRIWLTTPYFVPDSRSQKALCAAAQRGIDVRVLLPAHSDVLLTRWAGHAAYSRLLAAGVRIWEYLPRVLHAKTVLVDQDWATIGTANFDYRSFFLNDELNLLVEQAEFNELMAAQFERDLCHAREVTSGVWGRRGWRALVAEAIGWWARRWL